MHFTSALHFFVCMERLNDPDVCTLYLVNLVHMPDNGPLTQKYSTYEGTYLAKANVAIK